jgi:arabinofuranosyltransferase
VPPPRPRDREPRRKGSTASDPAGAARPTPVRTFRTGARRAAAPPPPRAEGRHLAWARPVGIALLVAAVPLLYLGWRTFWFLTDDAHIAFRYVAQSVAGHGYVWNAAPFRPVEGYTSFLFVALLDGVWRLTGVAPPTAANPILLLFGYATLGLGLWLGLRMPLGPRLEPVRLPLLGIAALAVVANRTFLAWTSSGLETSMFNFLLTLWIACCIRLPLDTPRGLTLLAGSASLVYLTRPDGALPVLATVALWALWVARARPAMRRSLAPLAPLLVVAAHLAWRRRFYGEWVPNTYFAKVAAAWPESGARYLLSFVLEYALWAWLALAAAVVWARYRGPRSTVLPARPSIGPVAAAATVLAHLGYYTLITGGDHFEYRVFSYTPLLVFVSFVWLLGQVGAGPRLALSLLGAFALCSLPIPWVHWYATKDLRTAQQTFILTEPVAPRFPALARPYVELFDELQLWLIQRYACVRHQEHKVFFRYLHAEHQRPPGPGDFPGAYPVAALGNPGTYTWNVPAVNVIDLGGLSDRVIARAPGDMLLHRLAHDRRAPVGYVECFRPNVTWAWQGFVATARELPLSPNEIRRCEARTWSPRGRASEAEAPAGATPEGWAGLLRAGFGHPTREGLALATRLFAQMETFEAYGYAERHPDVARLIPRGTPFRVIERDWLAGRALVALRTGPSPLWVPTDLFP